MLFILTMLIHIVRDNSRRISIPILLQMILVDIRVKKDGTDSSDWRSKRYVHEYERLFKHSDERRQLQLALTVFKGRNAAIMTCLVTSHPIFFLGALLTALLVPIVYMLNMHRTRPDLNSVGLTINTIRAYDAESSRRRH